eukprot:TRINITY_DN5983_c0_g1_i12.p1 TRINITY_DN5983_c0_g1~~TRINITY_DN5983_c0_g1_i12.p1  ORF type:complete len:1125 (-),score=231.13 TRINITY_DN5983_c0_g1_i12:4-2904(-)
MKADFSDGKVFSALLHHLECAENKQSLTPEELRKKMDSSTPDECARSAVQALKAFHPTLSFTADDLQKCLVTEARLTAVVSSLKQALRIRKQRIYKPKIQSNTAAAAAAAQAAATMFIRLITDGKMQEMEIPGDLTPDGLAGWLYSAQTVSDYDIFIRGTLADSVTRALPLGSSAVSGVGVSVLDIVIARRASVAPPSHTASNEHVYNFDWGAGSTVAAVAGPDIDEVADLKDFANPCGEKSLRLPLEIDEFLEHPPVPSIQVVLESSPAKFDPDEFRRCIADSIGHGLTPDDVVLLSVKSGSTDIVFMLKKGFETVKAIVVDFAESTSTLATKISKGLKSVVKKVVPQDKNEKWTKGAACKALHHLSVNEAGYETELINLVESASKINQATARWLRKYKQKLTSEFEKLLQSSGQDFLVECTVVISPLLDEFVQNHGDDYLIPVFHGTATEYVESILKNGFYEKPANQVDPGYFGRGIYFTPEFEYALYYRAIRAHMTSAQEGAAFSASGGWNYLNEGEVTDVIGAVLAPGKIYDLGPGDAEKGRASKFYGKEISPGYNCHRARVAEPNFFLCTNEAAKLAEKKRVFTEYIARKSHQALPFFHITARRMGKLLIWRDPNIENPENSALLKLLRKENSSNIYGVKTAAEVTAILQQKQRECTPYLITNGFGGEDIVKAARAQGLKTPILVYCMDVQRHSVWAKKYKDVIVKNQEQDVIDFLHTNLSQDYGFQRPEAIQAELEATKQSLVHLSAKMTELEMLKKRTLKAEKEIFSVSSKASLSVGKKIAALKRLSLNDIRGLRLAENEAFALEKANQMHSSVTALIQDVLDEVGTFKKHVKAVIAIAESEKQALTGTPDQVKAQADRIQTLKTSRESEELDLSAKHRVLMEIVEHQTAAVGEYDALVRSGGEYSRECDAVLLQQALPAEFLAVLQELVGVKASYHPWSHNYYEHCESEEVLWSMVAE